MKIPSACCLLLGALLPVAAAKPAASTPDKTPAPKTHESTTAAKPASQASKPAVAASQSSTPAPTPSIPVPVQPAGAKPAVTLDAYLDDLATTVPLTKDEQAEIKKDYLDDGAKLQETLNDPSLSPLQQTQQVDALRQARNAKIEELLKDGYRRKKFFQVEANYRVALIELATNGGLSPSSTPSQPVPAKPADKPAPAT